MTLLKRWCAVVSLLITWGLVATAQQPSQPGEFLPVDQLPPQDQLPAAPLLITAYAFVLVVLFLYVLSVARRLANVQREIDRLDTAMKQGGRA